MPLAQKYQCDLIIILSLDLSIIPSYFDLMHLNLIIYTLIQINYFLPSKRDNKCCLLVVLSYTILNHIETHYNEFTIVYSNVYLLEIPIFVDLFYLSDTVRFHLSISVTNILH